jgi:ferredoxin
LIDAEGKALAFADVIPEYEESAEEAAGGCPAGVITIETIT